MNKELEVAAEQGELFDALRLQSLKTIKTVLDLPNDLEHFGGDHLAHHRRLQLQLNAAQSHIANAVKVDDTKFRMQQQQDWLEAFNKKLAEAEAKLLAIEGRGEGRVQRMK